MLMREGHFRVVLMVLNLSATGSGRNVSTCLVTRWPAIGIAALHRFGESQRVGSDVILQREVFADVTEPLSTRRGARLQAMS